MKRFLFYLFLASAIALLLASGWFLWHSKRTIALSAIIPEDATAIAHCESISDFTTLLNHDGFGIWAQYAVLPKMPGLLSDSSQLTVPLRNSPFTVSVHGVAPRDFALLFFFKHSRKLQKLQRQFQNDSLTIKRKLFGTVFYENPNLTAVRITQQYWVCSTSPLLIEEVIRRKAHQHSVYTPNSFAAQAEAYTEQYNLFVNFEALHNLLTLFFKSGESLPPLLQLLPEKGYWGGTWDKNAWKGTHFPKRPERNVPSLDSSNLFTFVPPEVAAWQHWQFVSGADWVESLQPNLLLSQKAQSKEAEVPSTLWGKALSGEVALATYALPDLSLGHVLISGVRDTSLLKEALKDVPRGNTQTLASLPLGIALLQVTQLRDAEVLTQYWGQWGTLFRDVWLVQFRGYAFFFSDVRLIDSFFSQIENQKNLANDRNFQAYRDSVLTQTTHYYSFAQTKAIVETISPRLTTSWQERFKEVKNELLRTKFWGGAAKKNHAWHWYAPTIAEEVIPNGMTLQRTIPFRYSLNAAPTLVRNHDTWQWEYLVRDRAGYLSLMPSEGKRAWMLPTGTIQSEILQIDRYANGKLQYLFAVGNRIFLIDRLGRTVRHFPLSLPFRRNVVHLSAIDYDGTKNYRIVAADASGDVYMFSKYGTLLPQWNPKRFQTPLATELRHLRCQENDYFLVLLNDGTLHTLRSNGQSHSGFPLQFNEPLGEAFHLQAGSSAAESQLTFLTPRGEIIAVNLEGKILKRAFLPRLRETVSFRMECSEGTQNTWVAVRQASEHISIIGREGNVLFTHAIYARSKPLVQYFDFGGSHAFVAITNTRWGGTTLYRLNGELLGEIPKNRYGIAASVLNDYSLTVYHVLHNKLNLYEVGIL